MEIRYVGKTKQTLAERLGRHIRDAQEKVGDKWSDNTHRANWLRKAGRPLIYEICRYKTLSEVNAAERFLIYHMKAAGKNLTNTTMGGDGGIVARLPACRDRVVIDEYQRGLSSTKIAAKYKTCKKRVLSVLKAAGVELRPAGCHRKLS
jgi:hypothetical protein